MSYFCFTELLLSLLFFFLFYFLFCFAFCEKATITKCEILCIPLFTRNRETFIVTTSSQNSGKCRTLAFPILHYLHSVEEFLQFQFAGTFVAYREIFLVCSTHERLQVLPIALSNF